MSFNQSRSDGSEPHYRKSGRSASSNQQRTSSGNYAPGDVSKGFQFQFGSIGMQIPARTSSAPPNLDEQKCDQARHDTYRSVPNLPTPSIPKQQPQRKDAGVADQVNTGEVHQVQKVKKDPQVSPVPTANQTQKPSVLPIPMTSMQMQFHQPQVPVQFGGHNPQIQSPNVSATSLQMPIPIPLPMGNAPQVQQHMFLPGLQPLSMQAQGIMHQGQGLSFTTQTGHSRLSPQLGHVGIGMTSQDPQQQGGKFGGPCKAVVKIIHPDKHKEVRLDEQADIYSDGGASAPRSHPNPPQSQPIAMHFARGILSRPIRARGTQGEMQRNSPNADRWQCATNFQQKGLIPSPQTPLQVMRKAEEKYKVGKVQDEEKAKQGRLKAILNKLTPQNFEKVFEQVKAVNINEPVMLAGVVSQIFDKALMEPAFCEMYANFCYHLAGELPDLKNEDNERITFKRLLVNKCQEEFERGEREQEEANKADKEGEDKLTEEEREERRIKARRRMLGNIRLIGELYKKKILTERIMHECIKKLLGQDENPDEEDVEALCTLMSTIGEMIDHPKAKEHMDAYFDRMAKLSNNMKLSFGVRLMLNDAIELRSNKWQQRMKVEGPKRI